jgi:hypothetical protein
VFVKDGWVWYLDERACTPADSCPGATMPTTKVFAMQLSTGIETEVSFPAGENPVNKPGDPTYWPSIGPGEFWPAT